MLAQAASLRYHPGISPQPPSILETTRRKCQHVSGNGKLPLRYFTLHHLACNFIPVLLVSQIPVSALYGVLRRNALSNG
jgi:hypothetical protein